MRGHRLARRRQPSLVLKELSGNATRTAISSCSPLISSSDRSNLTTPTARRILRTINLGNNGTTCALERAARFPRSHEKSSRPSTPSRDPPALLDRYRQLPDDDLVVQGILLVARKQSRSLPD